MHIRRIRLNAINFERPIIIKPGEAPPHPELEVLAFPAGGDGTVAYKQRVIVPGREFTGGVIADIENVINKVLAYEEETNAQDS